MGKSQEWKLALDQYIRQGDPGLAEKSAAWQIAIGLQDVDGLKISEYLLKIAKEHIEGRIDMNAAKTRIQTYYEKRKGHHTDAEERTREADLVSLHIVELLGEKTFQLLCQAAGRAGRGDKRGDVIIQTYSPEHYSITTAAEHSYENFFKEEYTYRQLMGYPPCAHMLVILVQSGDESQSVIARLRIEKMIEQSQVGQEVPVQILTPGQASLSKLKDVYRQVLYLKHKDKETLLDLKRRLEPVLEKHPMFAGITIQFDFDPLSHY